MARAGKSFLLKGVRGAIGKELVIKQYSYGTVITKYPDMSGIKRTVLQRRYQKRFKEAVAYAKGIIRDPKKKAAYSKKLKKGKTVYNAAIQEYLRKNKNN